MHVSIDESTEDLLKSLTSCSQALACSKLALDQVQTLQNGDDVVSYLFLTLADVILPFVKRKGASVDGDLFLVFDIDTRLFLFLLLAVNLVFIMSVSSRNV